MNDRLTILQGDALEQLRTLPDESVQCCVTSPPYFGLRRYLNPGDPLAALEIGQEKTPNEFIANLVGMFREVRRALRDDGTLWVNMGDSYASKPGQHKRSDGVGAKQSTNRDQPVHMPLRNGGPGIKPKDLIGIPWLLAFALRADGWWLRQDIIWAKANCMPESVTDRCTKSHEYIFMLSKSASYFYDHEAIKEPCIWDLDATGTAARKARQKDSAKSLPTEERNGIRPGGYKNSVNFDGKNNGNEKQRGHSRRHDGFNDMWDAMKKTEQCTGMRNKRDVWTVASANYPEAHFATFPPDLIRTCILAGSRAGDTVLDPFGGSGTTGMVALEYGRKAVLIELNPEYAALIRQRCDVTPGMAL